MRLHPCRQLLAAGRTVVAGVRSLESASAKFADAGLKAGAQASGGILFVQGARGRRAPRDCTSIETNGVDITNPSTLTPELFAGVTQVVCSVGPVYGRTPEGGFAYVDGMTPARVDAEVCVT